MLVLAGLAVLLAAYDSAILVLGLPGIAAEFQAPVPQLSELGSVLALGALGALPLAALADVVGRRRVLAVAVLCFSLIDIASALAPSLGWLAGARLVGVCFETVTGGVATALVVEEMPARRRALAVSALTLAAGLGIGLTTVAYPLVAPHWRWLYWAGASGVVAAPVIWLALPDPAVWARAAHASRTLLRAMAEPPFRGRLTLLVVVTALAAVFYEPAGLFVVLFGSQSLHMSSGRLSAVVVAAGLVGAVCFAAGGWLGDRYGRRSVGVALSLLTPLAAGLTFATAAAAVYVGGNILWSALASAAAPVTGAWFAELFPTRARATSEAVVAVSTAVGAIAGLQLVALLDPRIGLGPAVALAAVAALGGAGLLLWLPETKGLPLPD
ncbi:MAG TPA: MFS transporter [Candidatus Dormibacteraeota bacterium]